MLLKAVFGVALTIASVDAQAAVVPFRENPSTHWVDGTMTYNLSPYYGDGFFNSGDGPTKAFNGYGVSGESILFNSAVTLGSLAIGNCILCSYSNAPKAATVTVTLFGANGGELASQTIVPQDALTLLTFGTEGVRKATFSFTGGIYNYYSDGRSVAFYGLSDVTYFGGTYTGTYTGPSYTAPIDTPNPGETTGPIEIPSIGEPEIGIVTQVPEAATWMLMIVGFGVVGLGMRQRRIARTA